MDKMTFEFILYCKNRELSRDFYSILLQKQPSLDVSGMTEFHLSDNLKLGLMPENGIAKILKDKTPHPSLGNGIPRCELYFYTGEIESFFTRGLQAGGKLISAIEDRNWGDRVGYLADPDGHIIAVAEKINY